MMALIGNIYKFCTKSIGNLLAKAIYDLYSFELFAKIKLFKYRFRNHNSLIWKTYYDFCNFDFLNLIDFDYLFSLHDLEQDRIVATFETPDRKYRVALRTYCNSKDYDEHKIQASCYEAIIRKDDSIIDDDLEIIFLEPTPFEGYFNSLDSNSKAKLAYYLNIFEDEKR